MSYVASLAAVLMDQTSYFQKAWIESEFLKNFPPAGQEDFRRAWSSFEGDGSLVGFDLEHDGLSGALLEHEEHGQLKMEDLFLVAGGEIYFGLGAAFPVRLYEMKSAVTEAALSAGLSDAARTLAKLPIDSSSWTGTPASFTLNATTKSKLADFITSARDELASSELTNAEHSKADAYLDCALLLLEQDEPDPDIIGRLIQAALIVIGAIGLLADLKGIFGSE